MHLFRNKLHETSKSDEETGVYPCKRGEMLAFDTLNTIMHIFYVLLYASLCMHHALYFKNKLSCSA